MGKASRTKRQRRLKRNSDPDFVAETMDILETGAAKRDSVPIAYENDLRGVKSLYRFLDTEKYAADLLSGKVWITTLSSCRTAEGPERADAQEGMLTHQVNFLSSEDPQFKTAIEQTGIFAVPPGASNIMISGGGKLVGVSDTYVLCFTERHAPEAMNDGFGKWCVEINHPIEFFRTITGRLCALKPVECARLGRVKYSGREVADYEIARAYRGLLKPKDGYTQQQEVRMLWEVHAEAHPLQPFLLDCPEAAKFCVLKNRGH